MHTRYAGAKEALDERQTLAKTHLQSSEHIVFPGQCSCVKHVPSGMQTPNMLSSEFFKHVDSGVP